MSKSINRRDWLRSMGVVTAGVALANAKVLGAPTAIKHSTVGATRKFMEWTPLESETSVPVEMKARLLANENPYGPSELAKQAVINSVAKGNRYGQGDSMKLIEMIAQKEGVSKECIMLAPGSSDLLEKAAIIYFLEGGNIVSADPAYMSLIKCAEAVKAEWKPVPLTNTWAHDLKAMEAAIDSKTQLVYICNPNNPTGTITDGKALWAFCSKVSSQVPVFVDEAYLELMEAKDKMSMVGLINEGKNVIVCRTFSKIYGMAGLRVGYIVAQPETIQKIEQITRGNMSMNVTAVEAAMAALKDDAFVEQCYTKNKECRTYLCTELSKMGINYLPSQTNFVLFPIAMQGQVYLTKMNELGIGVRSFEIAGKTYCRVSVGTMEEVKMFLSAFKEVMV